jgi:hypothetical protein
MALYVASQLKDDLRAATLELCSQLRSADESANVVALFYIFDGGNGYFYIYVARGWDPRTVVWRSVLDQPIAKEGSFSQVRERHRRISEGLVSDAEILEDDSALLEDGRIIPIGFGDEAFNAFLAAQANEVLKEERVHQLLRLLRNPLGCTAYFADDEVTGHRRYLASEIPE